MEAHLRNDLSYSNFSDPGFRVWGGGWRGYKRLDKRRDLQASDMINRLRPVKDEYYSYKHKHNQSKIFEKLFSF